MKLRLKETKRFAMGYFKVFYRGVNISSENFATNVIQIFRRTSPTVSYGSIPPGHGYSPPGMVTI